MHFKAFLFFSFAFFSVGASAQKAKNESLNNGVDRPKLVIGIVVDQMRWDYLYRYYNRYGEGGFKRLLRKGFSFENTMVPYIPAVTAAGHTALYTGSVPAVDGIIGNDWVEKVTGRRVYCTDDDDVQTVGTLSPEGRMSPRNLLVTTIGDELRLATNNRSRVFGVALKDRAAIFPSGQHPNAAYWLDDSTGNWISSTYYMKGLPAWVQNINAAKKPDIYLAAPWTQLYGDEAYDQSAANDSAYERTSPYDTANTFPHHYSSVGGKDYDGFRGTPAGNTFTLDFAEQLMQHEMIGISGQTDMLCVSLSSTDYIGHRFGPQSKEMEDGYLRLDRDLADFFSFLDKTIGEGNYTLFLSADHGALQTPAFLKADTISAGTLSGTGVMRDLNIQLFAKYGVKNLLQNYFEYQFYFDYAKLDSARIDHAGAEDFTVSLLMKRPEIVTVFSYRNFGKIIIPDVLRKKLENGYYPKRSGDIQMILKPQYTDNRFKGTDHGAWFPYDVHIPLLFYGWGIKAGHTNRETYMTDIAPTICAMLHIQMPSGCVGKVLPEIAP